MWQQCPNWSGRVVAGRDTKLTAWSPSFIPFRGSAEIKSLSSCSQPKPPLAKAPWKIDWSNSLRVWLQTHYQEHFKFIEIFSSPAREQQVSGAHAQPPEPLALFSSVFIPSETFFLPSRHSVEWSGVVSGSGGKGPGWRGWFARERKIGGLVWTECIEQKEEKAWEVGY